ncbi:polysaccharide biosynthesis/export family protein [Sphingopyxis sp. H050]|uniref:polysaccharide biosynthesis/export family protein n=1 Tax=Sphingopyxis sp. H050 TaxID=1759072 RepID=UPI001E5252C6|nr:polysaccharide biosynthesis/export family protein [Sphingopyxis sp. H050]
MSTAHSERCRVAIRMMRLLITVGLAMTLAAPSLASAQTAAADERSADAAEAPVPAPPLVAPPPSTVRATAYRINAGDELEIYVWGEERLQRKVKVLPDGTIAFPLVGKIVAQGYMPSEVETLITLGLRDQYRGQVPQVTVSVVQPAGLQFSVMGRVKSPGTFTPGRYINVLEALSMAGGPSEFANLDNVVIIRKAGDELRTVRVRLAPLFKMGADANDIARANILRIETGDTVIVP